MKFKITYFVLFVLLSSNITISQEYGSISFGKAVNISGKQRMLSQKMSKAFLLMSKGINNPMVARELKSSKFIFAKQLDILTKIQPLPVSRYY